MKQVEEEEEEEEEEEAKNVVFRRFGIILGSYYYQSFKRS